MIKIHQAEIPFRDVINRGETMKQFSRNVIRSRADRRKSNSTDYHDVQYICFSENKAGVEGTRNKNVTASCAVLFGRE